jgi:membrane protein implicated in regulation of membrane protease activity
MALHYWWWIAAALLVIAELMTGSLYLLALAAGAAVAGVTVLLGFNLALQFVVAAAASVALCYVVHKIRAKRFDLPSQENPNVLMDVGGLVQVGQWGPNRTARVQYRGTDWDARCAEASPGPGWFKIAAIENNQLVLTRDTSRAS